MGRLKKKLGLNKVDEEKYYQSEGGDRNPQEYDEGQYYEDEPYDEEYYEEEYDDRRLERKEIDSRAPLAILDEIEDRPSYKGTFKTIVQGKPVDLHSLENYVLKISPYVMRTLLRYRTIRTMEEARNVAGRKPVKFDSKMLILLLLAVGMGILGIIVIVFLPDIMNMFKGGI